MESGLVTLEKARVLQYGRKRSGYLDRLKINVLQHLHIGGQSRLDEANSAAGEGSNTV
jgi:hypothetical protein